jgi:hypothetical protein
MQETSLDELSETTSTKIIQADQDTLTVDNFDLKTGDHLDESNVVSQSQQNETDATDESCGIKEVQLSDLVVATESIDLPSSQEAYEFKEFDLRD